MDRDEEAARLLDRLAGEVTVPPAPLTRMVDAARREQRRRHLLTIAVVGILVVLVLLAAAA